MCCTCKIIIIIIIIITARLVLDSSCHKARVINDMFGRLNITLVRAITRAILARNMVPADLN